MNPFRMLSILVCGVGLSWAVAAGLRPATASAAPNSPATPRQSTGAAGQSATASDRVTRGKKLVLKDGSFQLVRSYSRNGDRVRYYSLERSGWGEIDRKSV